MKKYLLLTVSLLAFLGANAQKNAPKTSLDALPDQDVINELARLPSAGDADTLVENVVVKTKKKAYNLDLYNHYHNKKKAVGFSPTQVEIIELPAAEKKVLSLFELFRQQASYLYHINYAETIDPAQGRIAYSWGSKEFDRRAVPPGEGDHCSYKIHGLDCSGFIYQIFKRNGIILPVKQCCADQERRPEFLKPYLEKYYFKGSPFDVKDMGKLKIAEMHSGDLMYFIGSKGVYHIAIVLANKKGQMTLYQCLGSPNRDTKNLTGCKTNMNSEHGILAGRLVPEIEKRNYKVVRISAV